MLLKNEGVLPLKKDTRLAVVDELADNAKEMLGTWTLSGRKEDTVSLLDALKARKANVEYAPCCGVATPFAREERGSFPYGARNIKIFHKFPCHVAMSGITPH